jgi:hypothetical protein
VAPTEDESLQHLLQNNLLAFKVQLQEISDAASREHALEKQLDKMQAEWVSFQVGIVSNWSHNCTFEVLCSLALM